ncbi:MAG: hypothetical protein LKF35_05570 [Bifidobacterium minimum]|nr:hypothetical protein [Bifidobacterium minimum]
MISAIDVSHLTVVQTGSAGPLILALIVFLSSGASLLCAAVFLSRRRSPRGSAPVRGAHRGSSQRDAWRARVETVVDRNAEGGLSDDEAYAALARIAREFAEENTGSSMTSRTLSDIAQLRTKTSDTAGIDLLRHTIAALYPAEFSDRSHDRTARETTVRRAGDWVLTLVDRWHR